MKKCELIITDEEFETLKQIFSYEPDFEPRCKEDRLIVNLMKDILETSEECVDKE